MSRYQHLRLIASLKADIKSGYQPVGAIRSLLALVVSTYRRKYHL